MKKAETSLFVFGLYMILIVGTGFMVMPGFALGTFNLSFGDDTWIRFEGMMATIIGVYYIVAARYNLKELYRLDRDHEIICGCIHDTDGLDRES
jgi:hypothetical protein